jgi:hypothetical protein
VNDRLTRMLRRAQNLDELYSVLLSQISSRSAAQQMAASLVLTEWGYLVHPALVFISLPRLSLVALLSNICCSFCRSFAAAMPTVPCAYERGTQLPPVERGGVQRD